MGRKRRYISEDGKVLCPMCKEDKDITEYHCREVLEDTRLEDIWFERRGVLFGRPDGYCRPCFSKRVQGKEVLATYLAALEEKKATDILEAEAKERKRQEDYEAYQDALFETLERLGLATD